MSIQALPRGSVSLIDGFHLTLAAVHPHTAVRRRRAFSWTDTFMCHLGRLGTIMFVPVVLHAGLLDASPWVAATVAYSIY